MHESLEFHPDINKISEMYEVHSDGERTAILGPSLIVLEESKRYIIYQDIMSFYPLERAESEMNMTENHASLAHWVPADLEFIYRGTRGGESYSFSRQWVIWHVIEHDLHHGGEISFSLGMHDLAAIDI